MKSIRKWVGAAMVTPLSLFAQVQVSKPTVAVLGIDSKGIVHTSEAMGYMTRLELEKTAVFMVMDRYEVADVVAKNKIDVSSCFSKTCLTEAGKLLGVDKMLSGSVERFAEKIVITLRLIDVKSGMVERSDATEYLNIQPEIQKMLRISIAKIAGLTPDQNLVSLLVDYDIPIQSPKTQVNLNGPRMGGSMTFGDAAKVMQAPESKGGYNMYPAMFNFGWQKEWQYLSAGNFQALVEFMPMISGLESGRFIPSATFMNGFRMGKGGWEFAFGPSFRIIKKARGFYGDGENGTADGQWYLDNEWYGLSLDSAGYYNMMPNPYDITSRLDSRGGATLSTSLIFGVGRTFHSGYLNIPVNVYISPRKEGTTLGFSFGFNIQKKKRIE